jgi:translocation and assembly module TamB
MPVDDRDDRSAESGDKSDQRTAPAKTPTTPRQRRSLKRLFTRRNAIIGAITIIAGISLFVLIVALVYRLGYVDAFVASQIKETFGKYGIRAEIKTFRMLLPQQSVEMQGIELFDGVTGEKLGKIDRLVAAVRIGDLYAVDLRRHVDLKDLQIEGLEVWVKFDDQGRSNFRNIHIPPPEPNQRILFAYSTAHVEIKNSLIHYGDAQHTLSGEARNLKAVIDPDDPNAPAGPGALSRVNLAVSNSTFVYDGRPVNNIDIDLHGRVNENRAEIQELVLRSPVAEAHLKGTLDDWRAMRYQMTITSTVDLTQLSEVVRPGSAMRGAGNFTGTVNGEGDRYKIQGSITSEALAADGLRLQGLNVTASGSGQGRSYDLNGRAVAALLAAGDFQLNSVQLTGGVMGTGADFRWIGELRAASERSYGSASIVGLILHDAVAEMKDNVLTASARQFSASEFTSAGARAKGINAWKLHLRNENNSFSGAIDSVTAGEVATTDTHIKDVKASGIDLAAKHEGTIVNIKEVSIGGVTAPGVEIGSFNIAGVRLSLRSGAIEGSSDDINPGAVKLTNGNLTDVKLAKMHFVIEPAGRYRASADLSIGGGVLGQMNMGHAQAAVVVTSNEIQLNDFAADFFNGSASGNATINLTKGGASHVAANFSNLEIAGPILALAQKALPLSGKASGKVDLTFPGTDFKLASGSVNTQFVAETGGGKADRTPISGEVALHATNGLFQIERVDLQTAQSHLKATGQFSFEGDSSLQVDLNSTDAAELQTVFVSSGFFSDIEDRMTENGLSVSGPFTFSGSVRGRLPDANFDGHVSLASLIINGRDFGALAASFSSTPQELRVTEGQLKAADGGGMQFALTAPRAGENNITFNATLDRMNAGMLTSLPVVASSARGVSGLVPKDIESALSGSVNITGIPGAMVGSADLRFGKGHIAAEPFESIVARATFNGPNVNLENVDARFAAGHITASGTYNTVTHVGDIKATGQALQLSHLATVTDKPGLPTLTGTADVTVSISGNFLADNFSSYQITIDGQGNDVSIAGQSLQTFELHGRTENKQLKVTLKTDWLDQAIAASIDLSNDHLPATIDAVVSGVDLTNILAFALPQTGVKLTGRASATVKVAGNLIDDDGEFSLTGLRGNADFKELSFRIEEIPLAAVTPFSLHLSGNDVTFDNTRFTGEGGTNLVINGPVAIRAGGKQNLDANGSLNLRVLNILSKDVFLSGVSDLHMRVAGSFEKPRLNGTVSTTSPSGASMAVLVGNDRWQISNIKSVIRFSADQAQIEQLTGMLGGGHVSVSGGAVLDNFRFSFNVRGDNVTVPFPQDFRSTLDADLRLAGDAETQSVGGTVNLRRAEYTKDIELADVINRRREESIEEGSQLALIHTTQFSDLRVEGRNALIVRNNLADLIGSVSLQINGPVEDPLISGRISATSGTMNFRNDRYDITRAFMDLPARHNADPIINVQGETQIRGYRITVSLSGPLSQPQASVRSEPALPQADVVSLITTGTLSSGDTGTSVLAQSGLGTATSLLTDALINAPAQRATNKLFGLNRFEISPVIGGRTGSNPSARLTLGKRISKEVSVTYSTNVTSDPNQILALEYRVSDRLSFVALYEQASTRQLSSRNNSFSFEIRFRKRF